MEHSQPQSFNLPLPLHAFGYTDGSLIQYRIATNAEEEWEAG